MKIEFIEEKQGLEPTRYYTEIDGLFVSGTLDHDKEKAYEKFEKVKGFKGQLKGKNVLESVKI